MNENNSVFSAYRNEIGGKIETNDKHWNKLQYLYITFKKEKENSVIIT